MTPKEKAEALVNSYRFILMNENTECGNEILCTSIAKQCALISVDEMIKQQKIQAENMIWSCVEYWQQVKDEILNL
jgi:hypothetical protein